MQRNIQQNPTSSNVYIGSIPFEWDEDNLKSVVCGLGNVVDVRLGFDHIGKNKGYAFIEYEDPQQAAIASQLISKMQVVTPGTGHIRRFRTEVSKDSFRSNHSSKTIIPLNKDHLPAGVQFPPEVLVKYPQLSWSAQARFSTYPPGEKLLNPNMKRCSSNTPPLHQKKSAVPPNAVSSVSEKYSNCNQLFSQSQSLPFEIPDKINETLSQAPPLQLIDFIKNSKSMLNNTESARMVDLLKNSRQLAAAATQALLLMGFIDEEVIQEAMTADSNTPSTLSTSTHHQNNYQSMGPISNQGYSDFSQIPISYIQAEQNSHTYNTPNNQDFSQVPNYSSTKNQNFGHSAGFGPTYTQSYNMPQQPMASPFPNPPSRWPNFPLSVQMKLSNLPQDQAELIVQVLALTTEQVRALPLDRQNMVVGIRQQYS